MKGFSFIVFDVSSRRVGDEERDIGSFPKMGISGCRIGDVELDLECLGSLSGEYDRVGKWKYPKGSSVVLNSSLSSVA